MPINVLIDGQVLPVLDEAPLLGPSVRQTPHVESTCRWAGAQMHDQDERAESAKQFGSWPTTGSQLKTDVD